MALKCLECAVYQPPEVKLCVCNDCPLFAFRPYRTKAAGEVDVEGDEVEAILDEATESEEIAA